MTRCNRLRVNIPRDKSTGSEGCHVLDQKLLPVGCPLAAVSLPRDSEDLSD